MKILQINTTYNSGSTGRIVSQIGEKITQLNGVSYVGFGRGHSKSYFSNLFKIGSKLDLYFHALLTRFFDLHGFGSYLNTKKLLIYIDKIDVDIIHLHNIHGYYLNVDLLFRYLSKKKIPVVWTLHDCWSFTGHCAHFMNLNCRKWENICFDCPQINSYPSSLFFDNSKNNYLKKKILFSDLSNLTLVPVSKWLNKELLKSFLADKNIRQIYNGVDLSCFDPSRSLSNVKIVLDQNKIIILCVANVWTKNKGFDDIIELSKKLDANYQIIIVGVSEMQIRTLPENVIGLQKTENLDELVCLYTNSLVLFNPTYEDTYPTINLESIACGTPVITYDTGGSPESISSKTGYVVNKGDIDNIVSKIELLNSLDRESLRISCRMYALQHFDYTDSIDQYIQLYKELIN
ncbi:MAG: hypothetical protein RLY43_1388 [Bacteroidota bacterium]